MRMSAISRDEVARLAGLARIALTEPELDAMAGELDAIVNAVAVVQGAVDASTPATSHPLPLVNVLRADQVAGGLSNDEALAAAPAREDGQFKVPQILGEEQ
jgi:aspartyl-tRNA(Asn)/glutamyl-tRNA(Gln) amidotransferase subunit C